MKTSTKTSSLSIGTTLLFLSIASASLSCKPIGQSSLATVDNVVADGVFTLNNCGPLSDGASTAGEQKFQSDNKQTSPLLQTWLSTPNRISFPGGDVDAASQATIISDIKAIAQNLPAPLADLLAQESSVRYEVKKDISKDCTDSNGRELKQSGVIKNFSCWKKQSGANGDEVVFFFGEGRVASASGEQAVSLTQAVNHSWLRDTMYFILLAVDNMQKSASEKEAIIAKYNDDGAAMVNALARDVKNLKINVSQLNNIEINKLYVPLRLEALDSYFCSTTTRQKFKACFPAMYQVLTLGSVTYSDMSALDQSQCSMKK